MVDELCVEYGCYCFLICYTNFRTGYARYYEMWKKTLALEILQGWFIDKANGFCVSHRRMGRGVVIKEAVSDSVLP